MGLPADITDAPVCLKVPDLWTLARSLKPLILTRFGPVICESLGVDQNSLSAEHIALYFYNDVAQDYMVIRDGVPLGQNLRGQKFGSLPGKTSKDPIFFDVVNLQKASAKPDIGLVVEEIDGESILPDQSPVLAPEPQPQEELVRKMSLASATALFEQKYKLEEEIGHGSYATVYRCMNMKFGTVFAVKVVDKSKATAVKISELVEEYQIMTGLRHRHIIRLEDVLDTSSMLCLVLELASGGDLFHLIKKSAYAESAAARLVFKLLDAIKYLHANDICHRDLKPDNILLARPIPAIQPDPKTFETFLTDIKVADFGFATRCKGEESSLTKCCGTPYYIAPEILENGVYKRGPAYGKPCDLWSIGVIAYILLIGVPPFHASKRAQLFQLIVRGDFFFPKPSGVSREAEDFVRQLLVVNPKFRLTAAKALEHSWIGKQFPRGMSSPPPDAEFAEMLWSKIERYSQHAKRAAVFGAEAINRMAYLDCCKALKVKPNSGILNDMDSHQGDQESQELNLSQNFVGGRKAMEAVLGIVASKKRLRKLVLSGQEMDNLSVEKLARTLERHPSITHIDLSENPISRIGALKLQQLIQHNRNIVRVDLEGTEILADRKAAIQFLLMRNRREISKTQASIPRKTTETGAEKFRGVVRMVSPTSPQRSEGDAASPENSSKSISRGLSPPIQAQAAWA